jgi:hypothetical protein
MAPSVLDQPVHFVEDDDGPRLLRRRRITTRTFTVVVSLVVAFAVVELFVDIPGLGIDTATTSVTRGGDTVLVRFARVTRPQLVTPLDVTIERKAGFDGPVSVAMSSDYLDLFISNDLSPAPSSETSTGSEDVMTFDPPPSGDVLVISWDIVAKPIGWFSSRTGTVSLLSAGGRPAVTASFRTSVRP